MKKWMYLIFPGVMLGLFLVFFLSHQEEMEVREADRKAKVEAKAAADKAQKDEAERKAREQALAQAREREEKEQAKIEERRAKQAAADKKVADDTNASKAEGDRLRKEAMALEQQLKKLHEDKDRVNREAFELAKQVELGEVARRNAELESARMTEMIARRAASSAMATVPPPPPAPAASR